MSDYYKQLSREDVLANIYIRTNKKFPYKKVSESSDFVIIDFFQYSGMFYYYKNGIRFEITKEIMEHFYFTIDEMIWNVNSNTARDFMLLPTEKSGIFSLVDINGDSVERILLNNQKIDSYLRTIDDGFGLEFYPAKYNMWYVAVVPIPEDEEYVNAYRAFLKDKCGDELSEYYRIDSDGTIELQNI